MKFLILDRDDYFPKEITISLRAKGEVFQSDNFDEINNLLEGQLFKIVFLCQRGFETESFFNLLKSLKDKNLSFVVYSDLKSTDFIAKCYEMGCIHFISGPISSSFMENLLSKTNLREFLSKRIKTYDLEFWSQVEFLDNFALQERPLFITGPTGVGKTKIAEIIHEYLFGTRKPFIALNCSEVSESLIESELFGYKKGSFTGAIADKKGLISLANGGTLFLDEIATMPLGIQKKILKVIDDKSYLPVGGDRREYSEFFLISATCENMEDLKKSGRFRSDLFYRIEGQGLTIKGLKERKEDILLLIEYFLAKGSRKIVFSEEALEILLNYGWPGNVRELLNLVECLRMVRGGIILKDHLGKKFFKNSNQVRLFQDPTMYQLVRENGLTEFIQALEEDILGHFYKTNKKRVRKTTTDLKISSNTFYRIKKRIPV